MKHLANDTVGRCWHGAGEFFKPDAAAAVI
jgi:hypothetical protein